MSCLRVYLEHALECERENAKIECDNFVNTLLQCFHNDSDFRNLSIERLSFIILEMANWKQIKGKQGLREAFTRKLRNVEDKQIKEKLEACIKMW